MGGGGGQHVFLFFLVMGEREWDSGTMAVDGIKAIVMGNGKIS